jgi:hypothetical protein
VRYDLLDMVVERMEVDGVTQVLTVRVEDRSRKRRYEVRNTVWKNVKLNFVVCWYYMRVQSA